VLVAFAERLRSVLRASDTAARLGGDEFSIVCENTGPEEAGFLTDRLRAAVAEPLQAGDLSIALGISVGVGSIPGGQESGLVYERLIRSADRAMYADKTGKRG
jgi:diguanylate cyclase (GGDEF)-like protein